MANRGLLQAAGSWSVDACCAVPGNDCQNQGVVVQGVSFASCYDRASSSDWLFGLWPGPPQRFEPTGTDTLYQIPVVDSWPSWGSGADDLAIGQTSGAPGGSAGQCQQGGTYRGTHGEICGGDRNWGAFPISGTDVEVWYPI